MSPYQGLSSLIPPLRWLACAPSPEAVAPAEIYDHTCREKYTEGL